MLILPDLQPQNVEQLSGELDEELSLIQQEAQLKLQVTLLGFTCVGSSLGSHSHRCRRTQSATTCVRVLRWVLH